MYKKRRKPGKPRRKRIFPAAGPPRRLRPRGKSCIINCYVNGSSCLFRRFPAESAGGFPPRTVLHRRCGLESAKFRLLRVFAGGGRRLPASAPARPEPLSAGGQLAVLLAGDAFHAAGDHRHRGADLPVRPRAGRPAQGRRPARGRRGAAGGAGVFQIQRRFCGGGGLAGRGHAAGHQFLQLRGHRLPDRRGTRRL